MLIELRDTDFQPYQELEQYQKNIRDSHKYGAMASFIGSMRNHNQGVKIHSMFLEHYPKMTEQQLENITRQAMTQWAITDALVIHRVGQVKLGQAIVLVAVWSEHRQAAFAGCREIMEQLKSTAPFWKKEETKQGERWVEPT